MFLYAFIYNQELISSYRRSCVTQFQMSQTLDSLRQIMQLALIFLTDITGRVMFVDVEECLRGV